MSESYDVLIVGAGPAGIAAACRAAEAGARVVLIDEAPNDGGQIWRRRRSASAPPAARPWLERLQSASGVERILDSSVFDAQAQDDRYALRLWNAAREETRILYAPALVLATGARELFLPFPGWTLPGVLGVGGLQAMLKSGASLSGSRVVIAGSGPLLLPVAATAAQAGAKVVEVLEQAPLGALMRFAAGLLRRPSKLVQGASYRARFASAPYRLGSWVVEAAGDDAVETAVLHDGRRLACDVLAVGYGLIPNTEIARLLDCAIDDSFVRVDERQETTLQGVFCAGEPTGIGGVDAALIEGEIAGIMAAGGEASPSLLRRRDDWRDFTQRLATAFAPRPELRDLPPEHTLVCRCEDVSWGALQEFSEVRAAKLATRVGMGPCQGRVCGAACREWLGWDADSVRTPLKPVPVGALSGPTSPDMLGR